MKYTFTCGSGHNTNNQTKKSYSHKPITSSEFLIVLFSFLPLTSNSLFIPFHSSNHLNTSTTINRSYFHQRPILQNIPSLSSSHILSMSLRAWTCHGRSQRDMVEKLNSARIIKSLPVKEALCRVDRSNYVENPATAYMDAPQSIGYDQTISAPHMHSHALEEILPTLTKFSRELQQAQIMTSERKDATIDELSTNNGVEDLKILDVGCGSGYLSAAFGRLVDRGPQGPIHPLTKGRVWGIDVVPELVTLSQRNIMKADSDLLNSGTVTIERGDGWRGLPNEGPFHAIHVGAAAATFPHDLMMQLHPRGGVMVIPVGADNSIQNLYRVERVRDNTEYRRDDFRIQNLLGVRYVPLVQPKGP